MKYIDSLQTLEEIDISHTRVTDDGVRQLRRLTNLRSLNVVGTRISPAGLRQLEHLQRLVLSASNAPRGLPDVSGTALQSVHVDALVNGQRETIEDAFVASLKLLPQLRELTLHNGILTESAAKRLSETAGVHALRLINVQAPGAVLKDIAQMSNLEGLWITACPDITWSNLPELAGLRYLNWLDLDLRSVDAASVSRLQTLLPNCTIKVHPEVQQAINELRAKR